MVVTSPESSDANGPLCGACFEDRFGPPPADVVERRLMHEPTGADMPCPECGAPEGIFLPDNIGLVGIAICQRCQARVVIGGGG
jgi:hypothetical protein